MPPLTGRTWTFSAHAKDIWTTPDWEKREKMRRRPMGRDLHRRRERRSLQSLSAPSTVSLVYHGLDLSPLSRAARRAARPGTAPTRLDPVRIVSVGRAVAKKGFDDLLQALAALPPDLHWRFAHIGGGELLSSLKTQAQAGGHRRQGRVSRLEGAARHHRAPARSRPLRAALARKRHPATGTDCPM